MPRLLIVAMLLVTLFVAPASGAAQSVTSSSQSIIDSLVTTGLPVVNAHAFDSATDPNKLLGRPGQYVAKVDFYDATLIAAGVILQDDGSWLDTNYGLNMQAHPPYGTIEVFTDSAAYEQRYAYLKVWATSSMFARYLVRNDRALALMAIDHDFTPEQERPYEAWFTAL